MARSLALFGFCIAIQIFVGFADKLSLSIDCGVTGRHSDGLGINWIGDDGYIKAGKAAEVQILGIYSREHNSLRYFPSQKKSCYLISGVTTGRKHMIGAHFFYGNYDGKSSPPSFDLLFDGNHWASVITSSTESYYSEVIYAPKRDNISVCLNRTSPNQTPFISILVIREFELGMCETDDEEDVLLRRSRIAFGADDLLRYPDDPYDRYWYPSDAMDGVISVARDNMSFIQGFQDIPGKALVNAITPASFDFLVDDIKRNNDTIIPPYQSYITDYNGGRYLTTGSVISLVNTADASLPPILNAMEVFRVQRGLAAGTNADDEIKHGFPYAEIVKITNNFEKVIGEGGSGSLYYGRLKNGHELAVKVLKNSLSQGTKELLAKVKLLVGYSSPQMLSPLCWLL
ncbi:putative leucine-rich repeat receptor-like serine/threonine-protein kinase At2g19230 [Nymphaea colorata]|nr:putative leucine-rich repeat receptor-like serine/threonine-protein kinase At2g19230 [Nymphaea colorata]